MQVDIDGTTLSTSAAVLAALGVFARKYFVTWSKENVTVEGANATVIVLTNLRDEITRMSKQNMEFAAENDRHRRQNTELAAENARHKKQIARLESLVEKIASKFDIDIPDLETEIEENHERLERHEYKPMLDFPNPEL